MRQDLMASTPTGPQPQTAMVSSGVISQCSAAWKAVTAAIAGARMPLVSQLPTSACAGGSGQRQRRQAPSGVTTMLAPSVPTAPP